MCLTISRRCQAHKGYGSMIWKILISLARLSLVLALFWMLFGRPGKRGSARILSNGRIEFAPDRIALWAYPLSIAYLFCLAVKSLISSHGNPWDFFIPAIFVSFALPLLFLFSRVVVDWKRTSLN